MLSKLVRPFLESGLNSSKLFSSRNLTRSSPLFQQGFSGTNSGASAKTTDKGSKSKTNQQNEQQKGGKKNKSQAESDVEQQTHQQEGPADKGAERKSSK